MAKSELEKKYSKGKIKMVLVFTSATGKLQACTTLCSYERMSWGIATAREQYSVVRLLMID